MFIKRSALLCLLCFGLVTLSVAGLMVGAGVWRADPGKVSAPAVSTFDASTTQAEPSVASQPMVQRLARQALERARARLDRTLGLRILEDDPARPGHTRWVRLDRAASPVGSRVVVLVHGLDDPGTIWDDAAPALREAGHQVVRFDYPNDQAIARSSSEFRRALSELRSLSVTRVDIVGHSMGGLVARDVLSQAGTGAEGVRDHPALPEVDRLILIGTPNTGSPLARLRFVGEVRDQVVRLFNSDGFAAVDLLGFLVDGDGQAGKDLLPGSAYLEELNARALPADIKVTTIVGRAGLDADGLPGGLARQLSRVFAPLVGSAGAAGLGLAADRVLATIGDGVVSTSSGQLNGVSDVIYLPANHRSMVRRLPVLSQICKALGHPVQPPAIDVLVRRLD